MRLLVAIFCVTLLASCGASVYYDYDSDVDFSKYKTYNYYPDIASGLSQLDEQRIIKVIDSIMQQRGFTKTNSPQFYINFYSEEYTSESRNSIGVGFGSSGHGSGVGVSGGIPIGGREINQMLTIDFIDVGKDSLFWQAEIESRMQQKASPKTKKKHYKAILQKALKNYPPRS